LDGTLEGMTIQIPVISIPHPEPERTMRKIIAAGEIAAGFRDTDPQSSRAATSQPVRLIQRNFPDVVPLQDSGYWLSAIGPYRTQGDAS
jgi:hypothetical protein